MFTAASRYGPLEWLRLPPLPVGLNRPCAIVVEKTPDEQLDEGWDEDCGNVSDKSGGT
jgi:hypothetical protein